MFARVARARPIRLHRNGRNQLEIIAQDPAGNETVARREAYLEVF